MCRSKGALKHVSVKGKTSFALSTRRRLSCLKPRLSCTVHSTILSPAICSLYTLTQLYAHILRPSSVHYHLSPAMPYARGIYPLACTVRNAILSRGNTKRNENVFLRLYCVQYRTVGSPVNAPAMGGEGFDAAEEGLDDTF